MHEGKQGPRGPDGQNGQCGKHGHEADESCKQRFQSAQTFRRGRALAFLERLHVKRSALVQQLSLPEYDSIKQVISGELKAIDSIIQEFIQAFELREVTSVREEKSGGEASGNEN
ncbi:MAG: hypothetical protein K0Q59_4400 [Paenibacillus sp.]|nr:hypothetical protein [Paenibacillus sp.]